MKQLDITDNLPAPSIPPVKMLDDLDRDIHKADRGVARAKHDLMFLEDSDKAGLKRVRARPHKWEEELRMSKLAREARERKLLDEARRP